MKVYDRWKGKLLSEMTTEELISAIQQLGNMIDRLTKPKIRNSR